MSVKTCPAVDRFEALLQGKLALEEAESLAQHVEACADCASTVAGLAPDTLSEALRAGAKAAPDEDTALKKLLERTRASVASPGEATVDSSAGESLLVANPNQTLAILAKPQAPDEIGRLGSYRVLRQLGQGGMGLVFEAEDVKLQRRVALKVMKPEIAKNELQRERFLREARTAAKVESDFICPIYQVGEENEIPFIAMPFLKGESLDARTKNGTPLSLAEIVRVGKEVAEGLSAAHDAGLIHRDIKPANIWLETQRSGPPRARILDFGLARAQGDDVHITQSGTILGTPAYMAPEQARGEKTVDARADLFSLGCVLYALCTGEIPFKAETTMGVLMALAIHTPPAPHEIATAVPRLLSDLIMQLLQKDPARRPQSAHAVIDRLGQIDTTEVVAPLPAPFEQGVAEATVSFHNVVAAPSKPRKRWPTIVAAAALLALVATSIVFFMQTTDGVVRIEISDPEIKLAIEGHTATITNADKQPITLKPGKHGLTITRGDFTFNTASFELARRGNTVLKITWHPGQKMVVTQDGTVIAEKAAPPAAVAAASLPNTFKNSLGMEFVLVPKGKAWFGGMSGRPGTKEEEMKDDFYLGVYEVTQEEWVRVMGINPSHFSRKGKRKDAVENIADADLNRFPVDNVSWHDCQEFIARLNDTCKDAGWKYRLPTEKEWQYACRGGSLPKKEDYAFDYYFQRPTNTLLPDKANFGNHVKRPMKVGSYEPNRLGLFDMHGNMAEWVDDLVKDGKSNFTRGTHGGGWGQEASWCRAVFRVNCPPNGSWGDVGLRVARVRVVVDPDRQTAEWVLSVGGKVSVATKDKFDQYLTKADQLPREHFTLVHVHLLPPTKVDDDAALANMRCVPRDCFDAVDQAITEAALIRLTTLPGANALRQLIVSGVPITSEGMSHLPAFANLSDLGLTRCKVENEGLVHLKKFAELRSLGLGDGVTDEGLRHLRGLPLTRLELVRAKITNDALEHAATLPHLQSLYLRYVPIDHRGVAKLSTLKELELLRLEGCAQITGAVLDTVQAFPKLRTLEFNGARLDDAALAKLRELPRLQGLNLTYMPITDAGLEHLQGLTGLTKLNLFGTKVTAAGVKKLAAALPNCTIESDHGTFGPAADPDRRAAKWVLSIGGSIRIRIADKLNYLRLLSPELTDAGLDHLKELKELRQVELLGKKWTTAGVQRLAKSLPECRITWPGGVIDPRK